MTAVIKYSLIFALFFNLGACKHAAESLSDPKDLAADPRAHNVMLLGWGRALADWEPDSYRRILPKVRAAFHELASSQGFEIKEIDEMTKDQILTLIEETARSVGTNGTMLWYISSHGSEGKLRSFDAQTVTPEELVEAFKRGRTFNGRVVPLRRLYMFLDYCNAAVTADAMAGRMIAKDVHPLDLRNIPPVATPDENANPKNDMASLFMEFGLDPNDFQLSEGEPPLVQEGVLFSVTDAEQSTFRITFYKSLEIALNKLKSSPQLTIGNFLDELSKQIAKTQHETFDEINNVTVTTPQRAVYYAIPDNRILQETFFDSMTEKWQKQSASVEPCPPWKGLSWNYASGRNSRGECINPANYCTCLSHKMPSGQVECQLQASGSRIGPFKSVPETDVGTSATCYNVCEDMIRSDGSFFKTQCGGYVIVKNPINRWELWDYSNKN